jgi:hypothetical protein
MGIFNENGVTAPRLLRVFSNKFLISKNEKIKMNGRD